MLPARTSYCMRGTPQSKSTFPKIPRATHKELHDIAQPHFSRQQGCLAEQAGCGLWAAHELAAQLGEELGRGQVLLRGLSALQGFAWLSCVI